MIVGTLRSSEFKVHEEQIHDQHQPGEEGKQVEEHLDFIHILCTYSLNSNDFLLKSKFSVMMQSLDFFFQRTNHASRHKPVK